MDGRIFFRNGAFAAALLLTAAGCSWFEADPPEPQVRLEDRERKAQETPPPVKTDKGERLQRRDPANDMFLGVGRKAETPVFSSESLDAEEQNLVRDELRRQDEEMEALRRRRREYDAGRSERQEWVYGFKPFITR